MKAIAKPEGLRLQARSYLMEELQLSSQLEELVGKALEAGLDRKSAIVALGGGVVGDLAGFVAASYNAAN